MSWMWSSRLMEERAGLDTVERVEDGAMVSERVDGGKEVWPGIDPAILIGRLAG
jgi:hypothetical protein